VDSQTKTRQVLTNPKILSILPSLRKISATAEYNLESHWAKLFTGSSDTSSSSSTSFPDQEAGIYISSYRLFPNVLTTTHTILPHHHISLL